MLMLAKGWEGRDECRLGNIYFTSCPGSVGPPGSSKVQATLEQSGVQVLMLVLSCCKQFGNSLLCELIGNLLGLI